MFAGKGVFPDNIAMTLRGIRNGNYTKSIQTKNCMLNLKSSISRRAIDKVIVESLRTPQPLVQLNTSQLSKTSELEYMIMMDPKGRDRRKYTISLPQKKNRDVRIRVAKRGGALEIETGGSQQPISVNLEIAVGDTIKKSVVRNIIPSTSDKAVRIRPCYWDSPAGEILIEKLSALDGGVVEKTIVRGSSR